MVVANNKRDNLKKEDKVKNIHLSMGIPAAYALKILKHQII